MRAMRSAALNAEINVTPLVDVCLVLLIIFMVVTPMMVNGVPVNLPKSITATGSDPHRQLAITVKEDGTLYVDAAAIRREQLASQLRQLHEADGARPVVLRADKHVHYGEVMATLDACRKAGYENVGLVSAGVMAKTK
jgi:biopolymer transport protein ExbD